MAGRFHRAAATMIRAVCAAVLALGAVSADSAPALLPDASVRLQAARYAPAETDMHWLGWIGAGAGLLAIDKVTAYLTADVETIIGNTRRAFDATQANYHLEPGLRGSLGGGREATLFFHHVSRHLVDRAKAEAVDWNILGLRFAGRRRGRVPVGFAASLGHATLASLVGYRWEATGHVDAAIVSGEKAEAYVAGDARFVTVERSEAFPRGDFLDRSAEAGARWRRDGRTLQTFVAWERRNDVFVETPGARSRALIGFRILFNSGGYRADESTPPRAFALSPRSLTRE